MIPQRWDVPRSIRQRVGHKLGRQRALADEGHVVLVLHRPPEHGAREREGALFWRSPKGEWKTTDRGNGLGALTSALEAYEAALDKLETTYEDASGSAAYFHLLEALVPLDRAARNQFEALEDASEAAPEDLKLAGLRERASDVARTAEILHEDAKHGLEFEMARQAELQSQVSMEMAKASHRLNLIAAVFLPLTAIGSMLGMNMYTGLEGQPAVFFWVLFVLSMISGLVLGRLLAGRPGR